MSSPISAEQLRALLDLRQAEKLVADPKEVNDRSHLSSKKCI
jgi:hypothetical protein